MSEHADAAADAVVSPPRWQAGRRRFQPSGTAPAQQSATGGGGSPYKLGRAFEYSCRDQLGRRGWLVTRSPASKSAWDLLAIKAAMRPLLVQCKRRGDISSTEWNELCELAWGVEALAVVTFRSSPRKTAWMRLDALRVPRAQGRPWTEIDPASCVPVPVPLTLI